TRLDLDAAGQLTITPLPLTPPHPVARLRGTWAELMAAGRFEDLREAYLEISLTDDYLPPQPMATLRQKFPLAMNLRLEVREEKILTALDRTVLKTSRSVTEDFTAFYQQIGRADDLATDQALFTSLVAEVQS
ncbi:MAG: exonuclease SbcCD subunit D C-terminal domain-containing protein, partial [Desulfovibrionaceae bacterium]|nr:exonuclease SbcCD subunit D C-terminal domain-containing protein [Desulfovibrionaceae bacterium]